MKKRCSEQCFCDGSCKEGYVKSDINYSPPIRISSYENILHITETENILNFRTKDFSVDIDTFRKKYIDTHFTDIIYNGKLLKEQEHKELSRKLFSAQKNKNTPLEILINYLKMGSIDEDNFLIQRTVIHKDFLKILEEYEKEYYLNFLANQAQDLKFGYE